MQTTHPEMATLLARQEQILKQLADLKEQMMSLKGSLNLTHTTNTDDLSCKNTIQFVGVISDEVRNHENRNYLQIMNYLIYR